MKINNNRSDDILVNEIKTKFGKDATLFIGDWSERAPRKYMISTPGIGIRRKLKHHFKLFMVNEYKTSCLYHKIDERCQNLKVKCKDKKVRELHSVLTYQRGNERMECINRDMNACYNIRKITEAALRGEPRPEAFVRQNATNPSHSQN